MKLNKNVALLTSVGAVSLVTFMACTKESKPTETKTTPVTAETPAEVKKVVEEKKTIKALLITGEGYHDYKAQKKIITEGTSKLIDIEWTIEHHKKADQAKAFLSQEGWADPYDVVVYNICHANETGKEFIESVAEVHKKGKPCVAIHCTMHSYHWKIKGDAPTDTGSRNDKGNKEWNRLLGVVSPNHGPRAPITVTKVAGLDHEAVKNMPGEWKTPKGELYNIKKVYPTCTVLANGVNGNKRQGVQPVIWVNKYEKAHVFGTTLGHHNETQQTPEFLKTIADGIVWIVKATEADKKAAAK